MVKAGGIISVDQVVGREEVWRREVWMLSIS